MWRRGAGGSSRPPAACRQPGCAAGDGAQLRTLRASWTCAGPEPIAACRLAGRRAHQAEFLTSCSSRPCWCCGRGPTCSQRPQRAATRRPADRLPLERSPTCTWPAARWRTACTATRTPRRPPSRYWRWSASCACGTNRGVDAGRDGRYPPAAQLRAELDRSPSRRVPRSPGRREHHQAVHTDQSTLPPGRPSLVAAWGRRRCPRVDDSWSGAAERSCGASGPVRWPPPAAPRGRPRYRWTTVSPEARRTTVSGALRDAGPGPRAGLLGELPPRAAPAGRREVTPATTAP